MTIRELLETVDQLSSEEFNQLVDKVKARYQAEQTEATHRSIARSEGQYARGEGMPLVDVDARLRKKHRLPPRSK